ncbi:splicing factor, arginine/serine-rich 19-like [Canna indica]|uniref:Splicing factor, arginine/serine-rich 19-like n=1 Tax=Canna indica TaxID=4628 RepID=A0AAQ3QJN6_9LILI|nr:splicing factor, arginine/serine-rich 19-like [Canna indica]
MMASSSWCLSAVSFVCFPSPSPASTVRSLASASTCGGLVLPSSRLLVRSRRRVNGAVCMAPEEEKITRRSPLDFPIEWERPKPGRRPDIFPQFSPMKTPLPIPMPEDPPEEDEEEEEEKKEEEEENPDKGPDEDPDKPEKNSRMQRPGWF